MQHLKKYGLTKDDYGRLSREQNGVCALCRRPETLIMKGTLAKLAVDHDHVTGRVRGLLCRACNLGIGNLGEDPILLRAAADYIERHR